MLYCSNHKAREAVDVCSDCFKPLCVDCVEAKDGDESFCYDCAVDHQLSDFREIDEEARRKQEMVAEERRRRVGSLAFKIVAVVLGILILAGAGFLLYGRFTRSAAAPEPSAEQEMTWSRDECMLTMQEVREALSRFYADHENYPASLQELEGDHLDVGADCPVSGTPYEYSKKGSGYVLSCPNPGEHGVASITSSDSEIPHYEEGLSADSE